MVKMLDFMQGPLLMGIINVTPDSFSDGGQFYNPDMAVAHGMKLAEEGAHILDIGGESTRPGAKPVAPDEEQARILPVIEGLKKAGIAVPLSVDTRHAATMRAALQAGAEIINDVSALTHDPEARDVVSGAGCPVILMHMPGTPENMQDRPAYKNVVEDVYGYLEARITACLVAGIKKQNIIVDPGIGFGKTLADNMALMKNLSRFHDLGCPVMLGASRKSFIEKICSDTPADMRLSGSLAAAIHGLEQGVQLFRVHDVRETAQAFAVWQQIKG
jgi:dihydropteroate synthase